MQFRLSGKKLRLQPLHFLNSISAAPSSFLQGGMFFPCCVKIPQSFHASFAISCAIFMYSWSVHFFEVESRWRISARFLISMPYSFFVKEWLAIIFSRVFSGLRVLSMAPFGTLNLKSVFPHAAFPVPESSASSTSLLSSLELPVFLSKTVHLFCRAIRSRAPRFSFLKPCSISLDTASFSDRPWNVA